MQKHNFILSFDDNVTNKRSIIISVIVIIKGKEYYQIKIYKLTQLVREFFPYIIFIILYYKKTELFQ